MKPHYESCMYRRLGVQGVQKNNEHEMIKVDGARCCLEL